jgi:hypothetical protein
MQGLSGTIGDQVVLKTIRGGRTIVCKKPTFQEDREFSQAQLAHQQAFREASAYGKAMKREPIYVALAKGSARTGYNAAVSDWFNRPQILEVDLSGWAQGSEGVIRVKAQDDVRVAGVKVSVSDEGGALLEAGEAREAGGLWWEYNPGLAYREGLRVSVAVRDLPGHTAEWQGG